jgi:hypothetical protein
MKALAKACGWLLKPLPKDHPMMTGSMNAAGGYDLTTGVEFRRALRITRAAKPWAELDGIFAGERLVGVFSPFDVEFCLSPYEAYDCRGYKPTDAGAVALNILVYLTATGQPQETVEPAPQNGPVPPDESVLPPN